MKLTTSQKNMVERIAQCCGDKFYGNDGYCENYDITHGHLAKKKCLDNLVNLGVVIKWHDKSKRRSSYLGSCTSESGFTLYKLAPVGLKMVYTRILTEESDNTLTKRIDKRLKELGISEKEIKKIK